MTDKSNTQAAAPVCNLCNGCGLMGIGERCLCQFRAAQPTPEPVAQAATPEDMKVYDGIAQGYFRDAAPSQVALRCRDLSDADMDQIAGWLGELERGDIGYHALCGKIIASFVEPVAQARWCAAVGELLGHLSDALSDETFDLIDTAKWNAVSALVGAHETARPPVALQGRDERWKVGNEFAPFHKSASHINPDYRDGWNACYEAARASLPAGFTPEQVAELVAARDKILSASLPAGGVVEPSRPQLKQILDGLARCHIDESRAAFLRTWIRDWTQHKIAQSTIATPQPSETQGRRQDIAEDNAYKRGFRDGYNRRDDEVKGALT